MTFEELLTLPLTERVKWLRGAEGPRGKLSHDKLAVILGTSRQTVISWESGAEPRRYADRLAEFSGFPREAWIRRGAEAVSLASLDLHLRSLEEKIDAQGEALAKALRALARDVRALAHQLEAAVPRASEVAR